MSEDAPIESAELESTPDVSSPSTDVAEPSQGQSQGDVWSSFRALPDFQGQDDTQIAGRLYASLEREKAATKALQQYQQLIPYAQEYLTHREPFEKWMSEQQRPAPQPAAQDPAQQEKWWNPPELSSSDRRYLVKDQSGRDTIAEDTPLHVRERIRDYLEYRAEFAQKFLTNPQEALGPMIDQVAAERAREIVEQQLREAGEVTYVSSLEQENKDWLYEQDGRTPTREGLMVQKYINEAAMRGFGSPQERWEYACAMVERDLLREVQEARSAPPPPQFAAVQQQPAYAQQQQLAPQEQPQAQNRAERDIDYLRREASRNPSRSGPAADPRIPQAPMTFEQRLRRQMSLDGIE